MINFDKFKEGCPWRLYDGAEDIHKCIGLVCGGSEFAGMILSDYLYCNEQNCAPLYWVNSKR